MKLETKYDIGQEVKIAPLEINGRIVCMWFGDYGLQYKVRYFDASEAKEVYFYEDELSLPDPKPAAGFRS